MKKRHALCYGLLVLDFALFVATLFLIFLYVPTEESMGIVQRIFYFHVPLAWVSFLAFFIVFLGSIGYLWRRESQWDVIASSSARVGTVFTTLFLISGSIWAKPAWGVWWVWSPRLTAALLLWFIYIGYLLVRAYADTEQRGARFAAVVGIIGFIDIPVVALATTLWRTQHPAPLVFEGGLTPPMLLTLLVSLAAFTILYIILLIQEVRLKNDSREIMRLKELLN